MREREQAGYLAIPWVSRSRIPCVPATRKSRATGWIRRELL